MYNEMNNIEINIIGLEKLKVKKETTLLEIIEYINNKYNKKYISAKVNNEIKFYDYSFNESKEIQLLDISNKDGLRIYIKTLSFVFIKACNDLFDDCKVSIEHSLSKGLYVEVHKGSKLTIDEVNEIKKQMKSIIEKNLDINRELMSIEKAEKIFKSHDLNGKVSVYKHRQKERIHVYKLEELYDTFYGYLAPSTGYIKDFNLKFYAPGVIIQYPRSEWDFLVPPFVESPKLAKIFKEAEDWGDILDVGYVGTLNDKIINNTIADMIRISEALHEKKIAYIADKICNNNNIKIILIAGPSSSGKTTFAQRLSVQLKVNGKKPVSISLDDYFVDRDDTPKDEEGNYDFESIDAIDIKTFNNDLVNLMNGKRVEIPSFNFQTGKREYNGKFLEIEENQLIIIEGIHGLNDKLTSLIPKDNKFKIYISALTQLNIDSHNRIPTTDTRLIRRMVRDSKYRGNSASRTLELWNSVRRGEEKYIFPYQEEANVMFNSALVYELSVLKKYAEPLLKEIDNSSKYYSEAKRLLKFLLYFRDLEVEKFIPNTSIIKEFIGGSCFREN